MKRIGPHLAMVGAFIILYGCLISLHYLGKNTMSLEQPLIGTRKDVLEMINCAEDYGHSGEIASDFLAQLLGGILSDDEIETYAKQLSEQPGYSEEDYASAKERLSQFRTRWKLKSK